jgi:hypothetical protein
MRAKQKVLLVGPDQEENLSLRYLASSLMKAGHDVVIAPFNTEADQASVVQAAVGTTMVGLSLCFQVRARQFLHLAKALKAQDPNRLVVVGGHYASCAAEELLAHHVELDVVVVHEGERTLVELANGAPRWEAALPGIPGLVYRQGERTVRTAPRPAIADLDHLPPPLRTGPARLLAGVPTAFLLGSRGCIGRCNYCCITTLHRMAKGKRFRQRDPEQVAEEMASLYHHRGVRHFVFHDDNFLLPSRTKNLRRLDALQEALEQRGVGQLGFTIKCRPQEVDEEVFRQLRQMGLIRVFLGIESANGAGLSCLGRKHQPEQAQAALALLRKLEISAQYTMMIFHPAATLQSCRDDLAFMWSALDYPLNFCRTEIYAGTPLEQQMRAAGRARGDYLGRSYAMGDRQVQWVSDVSTRLFLPRCWETGSLMERAIGLDHLAAVMGHYYDDPQADQLARRILAWRTEVNRDTLSLLEELLELPEQDELVRLREREAVSRAALMAQGLDLFDEVNELTLTLSGLELRDRRVRPLRPERRPLTQHLARHAAAALLAIGAASYTACDGGISEYAPPPVDGGHDATLDVGVSEYAPPPVDGGADARVDVGISEYAPPPVDGGGVVRLDSGISEYAPPPVDGGSDE